jgi:hypothetical protein
MQMMFAEAGRANRFDTGGLTGPDMISFMIQ